MGFVQCVKSNDFQWKHFKELEFMSVETSPGVQAWIDGKIRAMRANGDRFMFPVVVVTDFTDDAFLDQQYAMYIFMEVSPTGYGTYSPFVGAPTIFARKSEYDVTGPIYKLKPEGDENLLNRLTQNDIFKAIMDNFMEASTEVIGQRIWAAGVQTKSPLLLGLGAAVEWIPKYYEGLAHILLPWLFAGKEGFQNTPQKPHADGKDLILTFADERTVVRVHPPADSERIRELDDLRDLIEAWCEGMKKGQGVNGLYLPEQIVQFRQFLRTFNAAYKFIGAKLDPLVETLLDVFDEGSLSDEQVSDLMKTDPHISSVLKMACLRLNQDIDQRIYNITHNVTNINLPDDILDPFYHVDTGIATVIHDKQSDNSGSLMEFGNRFFTDRIGMPIVVDGEEVRANIVEREKVMISETFGGHEWNDD